jgi:LPS export ABC transporter protein LptC
MSRPGIVLFLFLVSIAIATTWLKRSTVSAPEQTEKKVYAADFFMDSFRLVQYGEAGQQAYQLYGSRMEHFLTDKKSVINNPEIFIQPEESPGYWQVRADQAVALSEEMDEITFTGNVVFKRPAALNMAALSLQTDHLLIKPAMEYLATDGLVTIISEQSTISGENLTADVKQGHFTMQQVKGRYVQ